MWALVFAGRAFARVELRLRGTAGIAYILRKGKEDGARCEWCGVLQGAPAVTAAAFARVRFSGGEYSTSTWWWWNSNDQYSATPRSFDWST
jgi:hypothetical protein